MAKSNSPPKGKFSRSARLLGAAGRYAVSELGRRYKTEHSSKVNQALLKRAGHLVESLDHLKGFPLKLGQMLSFDTTGLLPDEVRALFEKLQNQANPVDEAAMRQVYDSELKDIAQQLKVDWKPMASASLGQVYRATSVAGDELVLKIQYPGIEHSLEGDVLVVKKLAPLLSSLVGRSFRWDGLFDELSDMFNREIDYQREVKMLQQFQLLIKENDPWRVPQVYPHFSSAKIVAMEFVEGVTISKWLESMPNESEKIRVAHACLELFCRELFEWGLVQTDPNFANFMICPDGKLALLDFGATLEYGIGFVSKYRSLLNALHRGESQDVLRLSIEFNLLDAREDEEVQKSYLKMVKISMAPFMFEGEFVFNDPAYVEMAKEGTWDFIKKAKHTPPPRHLIFLHRKLGGLYSLLHRLNVKLDLRPYWQRWIKKD